MKTNILVDQLPTKIMVDGEIYDINSDFRICLRIILAFEDNDLTMQEKQVIMLNNLLPVMPENVLGAYEACIKFLNGSDGESYAEDEGDRLFSFSHDSDMIYAAFNQTHGIELQTAKLHWWAFIALFMDLGADTSFCNLVSLRSRVNNGKATKEERRVAQDMGDRFKLPEIDARTIQEKETEREFMALVHKAG